MSALTFPGTAFPPLEVADGAALAEVLTPLCSPVWFGCRTGLCGTCVVRVDGDVALLPEADADEREIVELVAPGVADARLACLLRARGALALRVP